VPLEWQDKRTDERGYLSTCNRYMVCPAPDGPETWQTWKLVPMGSWFAPLATGLPDEAAARAAAQADLASRHA
jgi:hypothetical protein